MPKRSAIHTGELPTWNLTKRQRLDQLQVSESHISATTIEMKAIEKKQRTRELVRIRTARYRERVRAQDISPLRKQKLRDLTKVRVARSRERSQIQDTVEQKAQEDRAQRR